MPAAYLDPRHLDTALTLGFPRANQMSAQVVRRGADTALVTPFFTAVLSSWTSDLDRVELVLRPEDLSLVPMSDQRTMHVQGKLELVEDLGGESIVYLSGGADAQLLTVTTGSDAPELQREIDGFWFDTRALMVFDPRSGNRLSGAIGELS